jgi:hypothetical protein
MSSIASEGKAKALPFISIDNAGEFIVEEEARTCLENINVPIAVVGIGGQYRTGKSYLLNILKHGPQQHDGRGDEEKSVANTNNTGNESQNATTSELPLSGFDVGHSVQACTKGIWLWGEPVYVEGEKMAILFLDTEGLGSVKASATQDARIFALTLLITSYFVYNSRGTIDSSAIDKLSLVVNLTKQIHIRSTGDGKETDVTELQQYVPAFMWVVRDFTLQLKKMGANGRSLSPRDYLDHALKDQKGMSKDVFKKNTVRRMLRSIFPEKDCVTLVRPIAEEEKLKDLSSVPWSELRDEFRQGVKRLREKVFSNLQPKKLFGKPLTGPMLLELVDSYLHAFNTGGFPTITNAWDRVVTGQCREGIVVAMKAYDDGINNFLNGDGASIIGGVLTTDDNGNNDKYVFDEDDLLRINDKEYFNAKDILRARVEKVATGANATKVLREMMEELGKKVRKKFIKIKERNRVASKEFCFNLIKKIDNEETAKAKKAQDVVLQGMRPPGTPKPPSVALPNVDTDNTEAKFSASDNEALTDEQKKKIRIQEQLNEIRRMKQAKQSGTAAMNGGSGNSNSKSLSSRIRLVQNVAERTIKRYNEEARGPEKWDVMRNYIMKDIMPRVSLVAREASSTEQIKLKSVQRELVHKTNELTEALASVQLLKKQISDEKKKFSTQLRTLREKSELEKEALLVKCKGESAVLQTQLEERSKEIVSLKQRNEKLEDRLDRHFDQGYDERKWLDKEKEWMAKEKKLQEQLTQAKHEIELKESSAQNHSTSTIDENEHIKLKERYSSSKSEITTLQEHVELLSEHLQITKDLLRAKEQEVGECEYHWASSKAKLAQCVSEKMEHENYVVHVLEPIVITLRDQMSRTNLAKARKLLDVIQDNRLMELQ